MQKIHPFFVLTTARRVQWSITETVFKNSKVVHVERIQMNH